MLRPLTSIEERGEICQVAHNCSPWPSLPIQLPINWRLLVYPLR